MTDAASDAGSPDRPTDAHLVDAAPIVDASIFDDAVLLRVDDPSVSASLANGASIDHYAFEGTAGQWVWIHGPAANLATFTVHDPATNLIANGPWDYLGSLVIRLSTSGRHYIRVRAVDANQTGEIPYGIDLWDIESAVTVGFEVESGNAPTDLGGPSFDSRQIDQQYQSIGGTFENDADVDHYLLRVGSPSRPFEALDIEFEPSVGVSGATVDPVLEIVDATGGTVFAGFVPAERPTVAHVLLPAGDHLLRVRAAFEVGARPFYWVRLATSGSIRIDGFESADATNGSIADAEAVELVVGDSTGMAGSLAPDDVDAYRFELEAGERLDAACRARIFGSGVVGFEGILFASSDSAGATPLGSVNESDDLAFVAPTMGHYVLRFTKTGQDAAVESGVYLCTLARSGAAP